MVRQEIDFLPRTSMPESCFVVSIKTRPTACVGAAGERLGWKESGYPLHDDHRWIEGRSRPAEGDSVS